MGADDAGRKADDKAEPFEQGKSDRPLGPRGAGSAKRSTHRTVSQRHDLFFGRGAEEGGRGTSKKENSVEPSCQSNKPGWNFKRHGTALGGLAKTCVQATTALQPSYMKSSLSACNASLGWKAGVSSLLSLLGIASSLCAPAGLHRVPDGLKSSLLCNTKCEATTLKPAVLFIRPPTLLMHTLLGCVPGSPTLATTTAFFLSPLCLCSSFVLAKTMLNIR